MQQKKENAYPCMIGTWSWGTGMNGSQMVFGKKYSKEHLMETFKTAYDCGFKMWDTAEVYGMGSAEKILGSCIEGISDVYLSTKHLPGKKYKKGEVQNSVKNSMERLGVKKIDLYWLHQPYCLEENLYEVVNCLKEGTIVQMGLSNCNLAEVKQAYGFLEKHGFKLSAVQNHFSLLCMGEEQKKIIQYCKEKEMQYYGYMVLEQGALSGHYSAEHPFPLFSMRRFLFSKGKFRKIEKLLEYQKNLAVKYQVDTSQIPIAWAVSKGIIPIVGLTKPGHAKSLAKGMEVKLTFEEVEKLEKYAKDSGILCKGSWEQ